MNTGTDGLVAFNPLVEDFSPKKKKKHRHRSLNSDDQKHHLEPSEKNNKTFCSFQTDFEAEESTKKKHKKKKKTKHEKTVSILDGDTDRKHFLDSNLSLTSETQNSENEMKCHDEATTILVGKPKKRKKHEKERETELVFPEILKSPFNNEASTFKERKHKKRKKHLKESETDLSSFVEESMESSVNNQTRTKDKEKKQKEPPLFYVDGNKMTDFLDERGCLKQEFLFPDQNLKQEMMPTFIKIEPTETAIRKHKKKKGKKKSYEMDEETNLRNFYEENSEILNSTFNNEENHEGCNEKNDGIDNLKENHISISVPEQESLPENELTSTAIRKHKKKKRRKQSSEMDEETNLRNFFEENSDILNSPFNSEETHEECNEKNAQKVVSFKVKVENDRQVNLKENHTFISVPERESLTENECIVESLLSNIQSKDENSVHHRPRSLNKELIVLSKQIPSSLTEEMFEEIVSNFQFEIQQPVPMLHQQYQQCKHIHESELIVLKNSGIDVKTGHWTRKEKQILIKNMYSFYKETKFEYLRLLLGMENFRNHFWYQSDKRIKFLMYLGQGLSNRSLYSIYVQARLCLDSCRDIRVSKGETKQLSHLVQEHGKRWKIIGNCLDKNPKMLADKFRFSKTPETSRGRWSKEEDNKLILAIKQAIGEDNFVHNNKKALYNIPWKVIAQFVGTRTQLQCRIRWIRSLYRVLHGDSDCKGPSIHDLLLGMKKQNVNEASEINWVKLGKAFNYPLPLRLQARWYCLRLKIVDGKNRPFRECLDILLSHYAENG